MKDLSPERKFVLEDGGTEPAFSGDLLYNKERGSYLCGKCNSFLFSSDKKFDSGSGWPSFFDAVEESVDFVEDKSLDVIRTEVVCKKCKGHLGHVFDDGPKEKTGKRFCINSLALDFEKENNS